MTMEINFTDRESYLEWRANWKAAYKAQSQEIRDLKKNLREAYAANQQTKASSLQQLLHFERNVASRMMDVLKEAKAQAGASRAAKLAQAA